MTNGLILGIIIIFGSHMPTKYNYILSCQMLGWVCVNMMQHFVVQTVPTQNVTKHIGALIRDGAANIAPMGNLLQAHTTSVIS